MRRVALDPSTIEAAAADFGGADRVPREALTVGLRTLLAARELLLIVTGAEKAEALHEALEGPIGPDAPASLLRGHPCLTVLCDRAAAARLRPAGGRDSDHVAIVLGHREPGVSAEHRISAHSRARLASAVALCRRTPVRAVLLTGYTHTDGLSEAEQMGREWPLADVPLLLEVAGRNTAENASRSLPIVLALGVAARVSVVTSVWHLRAPYFFAPYRAFGLELRPGPRAPAARLGAPAGRGAGRPCRHGPPAPGGDGRRPAAGGTVRGQPAEVSVGCRALSCAATPRAHASMAGQSRASRCSGGVFLSIARSTKLPGSVGTRPPNMTCSRAPSRSVSLSATAGVGAVGCSSTAPNGPLLKSHTGIARSAAA